MVRGLPGDLDRIRPAAFAGVCLEVDVRVPAAESLPSQRQPALAIARHARVDIRHRMVGQPDERAPSLLARIVRAGIHVPVPVEHLRPRKPQAAVPVHGGLRQPDIAAGVRHEAHVAPSPVLPLPDHDLVAPVRVGDPRQPERAVGAGRERGQVVFAHLRSRHGDVGQILGGERNVRRAAQQESKNEQTATTHAKFPPSCSGNSRPNCKESTARPRAGTAVQVSRTAGPGRPSRPPRTCCCVRRSGPKPSRTAPTRPCRAAACRRLPRRTRSPLGRRAGRCAIRS